MQREKVTVKRRILGDRRYGDERFNAVNCAVDIAGLDRKAIAVEENRLGFEI